MKQPTYIKRTETGTEADAWCRMKNRANRAPSWIFVVIDGPDGDHAVVDIRTAQEMGALYRWSV